MTVRAGMELRSAKADFQALFPNWLRKAQTWCIGRDLLPMRAIDLEAVRILPPVPSRRKSSVSASTTMIISRKAV